MKKSTFVWIGVGVIAIIALFYVWGTYNNLVTKGENATLAWQQVETDYQRRFDLIPNLVASVEGIMNQEKEVFGQLADARSRYAGSTGDARVEAAGQVESALSRLLVVMENYPVLKSSETVVTLMSQLEGTENRISVSRGRYNESVQTYNLLTKRFPSSIVANIFGFDEKTYFEAVDGAEVAPKVEL